MILLQKKNKKTNEKLHEIGNILNMNNLDIKKSKKTIWNDPNMFAYNRKFTKDDFKDDCMECKYGKTCKGGCLTASITLKNNPHCNSYCQYLIEQEMIT